MCGTSGINTQRTLYFSNFPAGTTYRDLLSVIKGGKVLSINLRHNVHQTQQFDSSSSSTTCESQHIFFILPNSSKLAAEIHLHSA
jgi:hypothetical protein